MNVRILEAETVVFLGFGYYEHNLKLIEPDRATSSSACRHVWRNSRVARAGYRTPPGLALPIFIAFAIRDAAGQRPLQGEPQSMVR